MRGEAMCDSCGRTVSETGGDMLCQQQFYGHGAIDEGKLSHFNVTCELCVECSGRVALLVAEALLRELGPLYQLASIEESDVEKLLRGKLPARGRPDIELADMFDEIF